MYEEMQEEEEKMEGRDAASLPRLRVGGTALYIIIQSSREIT